MVDSSTSNLPAVIEIDLQTQKLGPVRDLLFQRLNKRLSPPTIWRYINKGVNGTRLPVIRCGTMVLTSLEAVDEFLRRQSAIHAVTTQPGGRTESTSKKLKAAGLA